MKRYAAGFRRFLAVLSVLLLPAVAAAQAAPAVDEAGKARPIEEGRTGVVIIAPSEGMEKTADEAGRIYTSRGYKGVVPNVRDESAIPAKDPQKQATAAAGKAIVDWIGFQPFQTYSRVFVQISGRYSYTVVRPKPNVIQVRVPDALVSTENDLNELVTRAFPTHVDRVTVTTADDGSVAVDVYLKKPVGYLYRQDGKYVFVDVEL